MSQFKLTWDNTAVVANSNATGQRVGYRQKSVGGIFNTTGFTPTNDLAKAAVTTDSPILLDNIVYEFRVQTICTQNGPTNNDNGVQEGLIFGCLGSNPNQTHEQATILVSLVNTDITKARITLKRSADNSVVSGPITISRINDAITQTVFDLIPDTNYYWQLEYAAIVNSIEVWSSDLAQLGAPCPPVQFKTNPNPVCTPVTSLTATTIQVL